MNSTMLLWRASPLLGIAIEQISFEIYGMMLNDSILIRTGERVTSYIEKYVDRAGAAQRDEVLALFDNMQKLFPHWVIMTCPMMHPDIRYVSKNATPLFGYTDDYLVNISGMDKYFGHVHEADQHDLYNCYTEMQDMYEGIAHGDHQRFRAIFYYRFRKSNGQYMHLYDEKAAIHLKGSGNLYYVLFRDITAEKAFAGVKVELYHQDEVLTKIKEFKPSGNTLSKREQELVGLMRQGLSTKEIAWYLKISHNTVRNIKSKMFEKYNVNNSIELLNMTY
jgi:DNA-binding CsgD family transcriptional regulator